MDFMRPGFLIFFPGVEDVCVQNATSALRKGGGGGTARPRAIMHERILLLLLSWHAYKTPRELFFPSKKEAMLA